MLTVPVPHLTYDPLAPNVAAAESPVTVALGPVLADGVAVTPVELSTFALVSYRRAAPGVTEAWDAAAMRWVPEGTPVEATPLAYFDGQPLPWRTTVVAGGGVQFATAANGYPTYSFRGLFTSRDGGTMLGGPSAPIAFGSVSDRHLMTVGPGDGEKPENATQARIRLKNASFQVIGGLVVRRDSPGAEVTLSNAAGAAVVLRPDGSVEVRPAAGQTVLVTGDLETERIVYRPGGGGAKKTLA